MLSDAQLLRYSRHILLNEFDVDGQERVNQTSVLVIGCGGLGNACLPILAGAGIGHLIICDDDSIEFSNLQRQFAFTPEQVGQSKVEVLGKYLRERNPTIRITTINQRADEALLDEYMQQVNIVVDCSDNFSTRYLINALAVKNRTPLVSGSVIQFSGQLSVFDRRQSDAPCYACLFDKSLQAENTCTKHGVFAPLVQIIGAAQASEVIKLSAGIGSSLVGEMIQFEAIAFATYRLSFSKNPQCPVCGSAQ